MLIGLWSLSSCVSSSYLNQFKSAQEAFNRAAQNENQAMEDPEMAFTHAPDGDYQTARLYSMYAMGDLPKYRQDSHGKTELAKDGLLLTAYNIRALSEWKLGMYSEALSTARACRLTFENDESVKKQRDYIVMQVMEALVYNDSIEAYIRGIDKNMGKEEPSSTEMRYLSLLEKSLDIVKEQRNLLEASHPMQRYLCITQLSIAKNWKNLVSALSSQMKRGRSGRISDYNTNWKKTRKMLNDELKLVFADFAKLLKSSDQHPLYQRWKKAHIDIVGI